MAAEGSVEPERCLPFLRTAVRHLAIHAGEEPSRALIRRALDELDAMSDRDRVDLLLREAGSLHGAGRFEEEQAAIDEAGRIAERIGNDQLDDMVLLRSDGTPVYMLAVVVDDHDMGVTHVIRGDDHLNNAARQMGIYTAMGWDVPVWAHIPLIHGPDGKKLSKRHGALGAQEYQAMGYPAAGMRNYLARLGWSHGDDEYFTDDQARARYGTD